MCKIARDLKDNVLPIVQHSEVPEQRLPSTHRILIRSIHDKQGSPEAHALTNSEKVAVTNPVEY